MLSDLVGSLSPHPALGPKCLIRSHQSGYRCPLPASAFEHLKSLELCFSPSPLVNIYVGDPETACIRAAPSLHRLKLCRGHGHRGLSTALNQTSTPKT